MLLPSSSTPSGQSPKPRCANSSRSVPSPCPCRYLTMGKSIVVAKRPATCAWVSFSHRGSGNRKISEATSGLKLWAKTSSRMCAESIGTPRNRDITWAGTSICSPNSLALFPRAFSACIKSYTRRNSPPFHRGVVSRLLRSVNNSPTVLSDTPGFGREGLLFRDFFPAIRSSERIRAISPSSLIGKTTVADVSVVVSLTICCGASSGDCADFAFCCGASWNLRSRCNRGSPAPFCFGFQSPSSIRTHHSIADSSACAAPSDSVSISLIRNSLAPSHPEM